MGKRLGGRGLTILLAMNLPLFHGIFLKPLFSVLKSSEIIQRLLKDEFPEPGSARNRKNNAPEKGKTTLLGVENA